MRLVLMVACMFGVGVSDPFRFALKSPSIANASQQTPFNPQAH